MKWRLPFLLLFSFLLCAQHAFAGSLIWVERKTANDRELLLSKGIPLIEEFSSGFLAEGNTNLVQSGLDKLGFRSQLLDKDAEASSYAVVAFRSGHIDPDAASSCGDLLWAEGNWMLLRIHEPMPAQCRESNTWFLHLLSRKPLRPAVAPPAEYRGVAQAFATKPLVEQMVNLLTDEKVQSHWNAVVNSASTRYSTGAGCQTAAQAVFDKLLAFHLSPVFQNHTPGHAPNVIGVTSGAVNPDAVYIVIGHLDDMPSSGSAPGADDNASGSALVTALGDVMSCYAFANTVKFIAVTGEEFGLYGSTYYADDAQARGENIQAVLNADMIGWQGDQYPNENLDLDYNSTSQWLGQLFAQCAQEYGTGCVVDAFSCPELNASDHYPFWVNGWSAVCGITDNEGYCGHGGSYPFYHTSNDTQANCGDPHFYYGAARAYLATLAHMADPFKIRFDRDTGACSDSYQLTVGDRDLNTNPSVQESVTLQVWSMTEQAPESIVLTEQGNDSMIFSGIVTTTPDYPVSGDGLISVSGNDTITAHYTDAVGCDGSLNVAYTDSVAVDCVAPAISNVQAIGVLGSSATVTWDTNEAADSRVVYDTTVPPGAHVAATTDAVQSHSVLLPGLTPCTTYYYYVESSDAIGNSTTDTNGGSYYTFETGIDAISTYHSTDVPKVIRDNATIVSTVDVPDDKEIMDVDVKINVSHIYDSDLDMFLISPGGTRVELSTDNGGSGNNYTNTIFDDEAATPITSGAPPFTGSFRPEGLLSALEGASALGTWKLEVTDDRYPDGGYLYSWDLILTYRGAITFLPEAFPNGTPGIAYDQTVTATGGATPYSYVVSSGSLPAGLSMDLDGHITGTPDVVGTSNFEVTVTDVNGCIATHSYSITIGCLFCDEFDDGSIGAWIVSKPEWWKETGGQLVATPVRKAIAIADFAGCTNCYVESAMESAGGNGNKLWMFGWYADKKNTIELLMKEESDKWILRQRVNGKIVARASIGAVIDPNTPYAVRITFDGSQFHLTVDGAEVLALTPAALVSPGTVGFAARATVGSFEYVRVN